MLDRPSRAPGDASPSFFSAEAGQRELSEAILQLTAEWQLSADEVAHLLGSAIDPGGTDTSVVQLRTRLLLELTDLLPRLANEQPIWSWLRRSNVPLNEDHIDPLLFLSGPVSNLLALRNGLRPRG